MISFHAWDLEKKWEEQVGNNIFIKKYKAKIKICTFVTLK